MKKTFREAYIVKFNYQKPGGFLVFSHEEQVLIDVEHGINEKNSHEKAGRLIEKKYPGCRIVSIKYV